MHLEATEVFGNTSNLMYYYANIYIGDDSSSKQALILDTGSGITWFPWK